jgi:tetratricopeptide (TPR) repeat protein
LTKYSEAEAILRESLAIREQVFGGQHPHVAQSLSNLGYLLLQLHRYADAGAAFERALQIREATLSPQHPHLATTLDCLARVHAARGDWAGARAEFTRALEIAQAVYGDRHPHYAAALAAAGRAAVHTGSLAIAELQLLKAKSLLVESVGPNHRLFAEVLLGLADLQTAQRQPDQAYPLLERALAIQKGTTAAERLESGETLERIIDNLLARDLPREAQGRLQEVVELRERLLGASHEETIAARLRLAAVCRSAGAPQQAVDVLQRVMRSLEALSPRREDLETQLLGELAESLTALGRLSEAEDLLVRRLALASANDDVGDDLSATLGRLAAVYQQQGRYAEAEPLLRSSLKQSEQRLGPDHPQTLQQAEQLARLLIQRGQCDEAAPLVERTAHGAALRFADDPERLADAYEQLAAQFAACPSAPYGAVYRARADELRGRVGHVLDDLF